MALSWWMLYDAIRCAERLSISKPFGHLLSITEVLDMKKGLRLWFYLEAILGIIAGVLFVVTLINQQWIETVFSVDPDQGSGALEWFVVGGLAVVAVALGLAARYEWRRASAVAA
jgi:hypothetical protein